MQIRTHPGPMLMLWRALLALAVAVAATPSQAAEISLRKEFVEVEPAGPTARSGWTWISLARPDKLNAMPANWQLLVDQVRFEAITIVVIGQDGQTQTIRRRAGQLERSWALGGLLKFEIATPGAEIQNLYIGFHEVDDLSLMRKIVAATQSDAAAMNGRWLALMGLFSGLLISSFVFNVVIYSGQRNAFQLWYLCWVAVALMYGLTWSNMLAYLLPNVVGPAAVRLDYVLVGLAIALSGLFLVSILESGTTPRRLRHASQIAAGACVASGILAAGEHILRAPVGDLLLNLAMVASVAISLIIICVAACRQSFVVWIYLAGWLPVIAVFAARAARNFGAVSQSDIVDYATFAVIGYESIVFSLLIATRFRSLKQQKDDAEAKARNLHIEQATLERAANTDFLSGLGNRSSFNRDLVQAWNEGSTFHLYLIDVDYLKDLNDRQGHDAGDALLQFIGARLSKLSGPDVTCARIGGDEFAILARERSGSARQVSAELDALQGSIWAKGAVAGTLSLSVGKARSTSASSSSDLFKHADVALYEAKKLGRGRMFTFDDALRMQIQVRSEMLKEAREGIERHEFVLHFQPIVDLQNEEVAGIEALLRWHHPARGFLAPNSFNCVFQDATMGPAIQRHVVDLAIAWLKKHADVRKPLSVNFTSMDLQGEDCATRLIRRLASAGIPAASLCIEVTEGTILGRSGGGPAAALRTLHDAGMLIALDDFGTGYASLVHLKEIPVDILKIDRSFIGGLLDDKGASEQIVRAVLALGHGLKKRVVAEGVETVEQLTRLRDLGCIYAQGFLLGRPASYRHTMCDIHQAA